MVERTKPAGKYGEYGRGRRRIFDAWMPVRGALRAGVLVFALGAGLAGWSEEAPLPAPAADAPQQWKGLPVRRISFSGVAAERLAPLPGHLPQAEGTPLNPEDLKTSLRRLFATGLYETIDVEGTRTGDGVELVFRGTPRTFIGTVSVDGAKGATLNTQLQRASQLDAGTRFTQARLSQALAQMRRTLADNGYHEPVITQILTPHPDEQLVDIAFQVNSGVRTRVGTVDLSGDSGMSVAEFRRHAHLKIGSNVDHDTSNRALAGVLKHYRGQERLEAEIKLESSRYDAAGKKADFRFSANRGRVVKVRVEGASISPARIKRIVPVFEEGAVDEDLLNEGNRRLRDYYQRMGYFDVKVSHEEGSAGSDEVVIVFRVQLGPRRRVERILFAGNKYFDAATLKDLVSVRAADAIDHHGAYSQALVTADIGALQAVYQNNGFSGVKIIPETNSAENPAAGIGGAAGEPVSRAKANKARGTEPLTVTYRIEEGQQQRVAMVRIEGNEHVAADKLTPLMSTTPGQLLSPQNLAGDRDTLLTEYLSHGFEQVVVNVAQQIDPAGPNQVDVVFRVTEGPQIFVRKVLLTGLHYTRPETVARAITLHPGDPLDETALRDTQRNLYEFALFNEVEAAVENPSGGESYKTILLQASEARRWTLTYGFGFEAQTGTPQNNCGSAIISGASCNPNGKTGVSPRVLADLTRNNLFGREQSASLRGTYGRLEQKIDLTFQNPHFDGNRNFGLTFSGGYANSKDVNTYVASRLQAGIRWTENFLMPGALLSKANTMVYEYDFRRVKVAESSLQVGLRALKQLSSSQRVAGPGITWIRDTRDSPLDAHRGTYTSFQEFLSVTPLGAEVNFNRLDLENSSYYSFSKGRFVLARNTRYGQERSFGSPVNELIPLPERLYAGGTTSLRGFSMNAAGPRDPETGYPVGGAGALINSTELRLPPPTLPWLGNTVSFVLFHDMGNVFSNASDAWASALRVHQPNRSTCKNLTAPPANAPWNSTGPESACSFNYFSHAPGLGMRYHTPVGPIRFDFSYNLNPPIFPVIYDYTNPTSAAHVGEAQHFNFFFSLGQTF